MYVCVCVCVCCLEKMQTHRSLRLPATHNRRYRRSLARDPHQPTVLYDVANLLRYDLGTGAGGNKGAAGGPNKLQRRSSGAGPSSSAAPAAAAGGAANARSGNNDNNNAFDMEAEEMYKMLVKLEPGHSSALGELAQLAFDLRQDVGNARVLFDQVGE